MNLLVLGATGGVGRQVVAQALERGYDVTALVRNPRTASFESRRVRTVVGTLPSDVERLASAVRGQDAVISALGVGKSFTPHGLMAATVPVLVQTMERERVGRLIFVSAFGVGDTWRDTPWLPRLFIRTLLRHVYADKHAGEARLHASRLDWTVVCPTGLTDGPRTGTYRVGEHLRLRGFPTVARADVATCLLDQLRDVSAVRKHLLVSA